MSVTNAKKTVNVSELPCGGTAVVTLGFDAEVELVSEPADIILLLDRSRSMDAWRMDEAKKAAGRLIRTVADAGGAPSTDGLIRNGSRMGLVSFSTRAKEEVGLTSRTELLYQAIARLTAEGYTNHEEPFAIAEKMLGPKKTNRQVVVMFTDGHTHNEGGDPLPTTDRMKAAGIEIFSVGLVKDATELYQWASPPTSVHVAYTSSPGRLTQAFQKVTAGVIRAGARQIRIQEEVNPEFQIVQVDPPSAGTAELTGPQTLTWSIRELGLEQKRNTATLSFTIRHLGQKGGLLAVNRAITYQDLEGQTLRFPAPVLQVNCPEPDPGPGPDPGPAPRPDPVPISFVVPGCQDAVQVRLTGIPVFEPPPG